MFDSVQSPNVNYSSVENVLDRYRTYREAQGGDPNRDGVPELLASFDELDGPDEWARKIGNYNRTSPRGGVLKARAILEAARVLDGERISDTAGLRTAAEDDVRLARVAAAWCGVAGQRRRITWHYMLMLAGIPGVKPDRMICRFVADSLRLSRSEVTPSFAFEILTTTAGVMGMSPTDLDHAVWRFQRRRK